MNEYAFKVHHLSRYNLQRLSDGARFEDLAAGLYADFATSCLRIYLSLILFICLQKMCAIFLQSVGNAKLAAPLSLLRDFLLVAITLWLPDKLGVTGVFWAAPIADIVALIITVPVMIKAYKNFGREVESLAVHLPCAHKR